MASFFMRLEADFFLALKPSLFCHQTFVKVGFHDKGTGFGAFEEQMPYQKYQQPPILVKYINHLNSADLTCSISSNFLCGKS